MRVKSFKNSSLILIAGVGFSFMAAQAAPETAPKTNQPEQLEAEKPSLSVPYEEIEINGKKMPLTVDTLANLERYNQESELVKKVKRVLEHPEKDQAKAAPRSTTPAGTNEPVVAKVQEPKKHTLLSVFGFPGQMTAEVYLSKDTIVQLNQGDVYRGFVVEEIDFDGIKLTSQNAGRNSGWINVGSVVSGQFSSASARN